MTLPSITRQDGSRKWLALAVIVAAQFMVVLDIAIVNVALPSIKTDLHFAEENLQWVVSAYAILFGGALLLGGRLGDIFGRRRFFIIGLALFTGASLLGGLSWSEGSLIAFRALQGLGGALLAPATLSILMTTFAEGAERNRALGIWGAASGSGAAVGVLLGGFLTSYLSWPWVFFINVPVGLAVIAAAPFVLAESRGQHDHRHFDVAGAASVTSGVMLLVYAMTRATQDGWGSRPTLLLLAGSTALIAAFLVIELRSPAPLLPLRIFRLRSVAAANAAAVMIGGIAFSQFFLQTLYMQDVLGYSAIRTGVGFATMAFTIIVVLKCGSAARHPGGSPPGAHRGAASGLGLAGVLHAAPDGRALLLEPVPGDVGRRDRARPLVRADDDRRSDRRQPAPTPGIASGLINTSRQVGGAVGLAAVSTIVTSYAQSGSAAAVNDGLTQGFHAGFLVLSGIALAGAAIAGLMLAPRPEPADVASFSHDNRPLEEAA